MFRAFLPTPDQYWHNRENWNHLSLAPTRRRLRTTSATMALITRSAWSMWLLCCFACFFPSNLALPPFSSRAGQCERYFHMYGWWNVRTRRMWFPKQSLAVWVLTVLLRGLVLWSVAGAAAAAHFYYKNGYLVTPTFKTPGKVKTFRELVRKRLILL